MPHVLDNLLLLKMCLRKRPFATEDAARNEDTEKYEPYLCPACKKWHRRSKPHFKAQLLLINKVHKQRRNIAAMRKRDLMKGFTE